MLASPNSNTSNKEGWLLIPMWHWYRKMYLPYHYTDMPVFFPMVGDLKEDSGVRCTIQSRKAVYPLLYKYRCSAILSLDGIRMTGLDCFP